MGKSVPERVDDLESDVAAVNTRVSVIETELVHGSTIFHRLEKQITSLDDAFRKHMAKEEKVLVRLAGWLLAFFAATILGLIGYIWKSHVG
jgi:hypothetical protein